MMRLSPKVPGRKKAAGVAVPVLPLLSPVEPVGVPSPQLRVHVRGRHCVPHGWLGDLLPPAVFWRNAPLATRFVPEKVREKVREEVHEEVCEKVRESS